MRTIISVSLVGAALFGFAAAAPTAAAASAMQPLLKPRCLPRCNLDCTMVDCGGRHCACGNGCCEIIRTGHGHSPDFARCDNGRWLGY